MKLPLQLPLQPLEVDALGVVRFRRNGIVRALLEFGQAHGMGLNELAMMGFSQEEEVQFATLIGYSVGGFHELPYVPDAVALAVSAEADTLLPGAGGCRDQGCSWHSKQESELEESP